MNIVMIDNYDSFTYNLVFYLNTITGQRITVFRNDEFALSDLEPFTHIVLSPGPGLPGESGLLCQVIETYAETKSMLGICLGHQAIAEVAGGRLKQLSQVYHGKSSTIHVLENDPLFKDIPYKFQAGRYHSWVVDRENLPEKIKILAVSEDGEIMALRYMNFPVWGLQFHPESVLTPQGMQILKNWIHEGGQYESNSGKTLSA